MLEDAARALRTVRAQAAQWQHRSAPHRHHGLIRRRPSRLHASHPFRFRRSQRPRSIDRESSRPDIGVLCYAVITMGPDTHMGSRHNLLGDNPSPELVQLLSNELQVTPQTRPASSGTPPPTKTVKVIKRHRLRPGPPQKRRPLRPPHLPNRRPTAWALGDDTAPLHPRPPVDIRPAVLLKIQKFVNQ